MWTQPEGHASTGFLLHCVEAARDGELLGQGAPPDRGAVRRHTSNSRRGDGNCRGDCLVQGPGLNTYWRSQPIDFQAGILFDLGALV